MTRSSKSVRRRASLREGRWPLQDAKARFSELVRTAREKGPQSVTVHGREEVVVVAAEEFHRLKGRPTGKALVDVLRGSPLRDVQFPRRVPIRARPVDL